LQKIDVKIAKESEMIKGFLRSFAVIMKRISMAARDQSLG
jgi:hypothetical protein